MRKTQEASFKLFACILLCFAAGARTQSIMQTAAPFVLENTKAVAAIGMGVMGLAILLAFLLAVVGNCGSGDSSQGTRRSGLPQHVEQHKYKTKRKKQAQGQFIAG